MKIMIDAGHGFNVPGKRSPDGMLEYEFNRVTALYSKQWLETFQNVTVYFAHSDLKDVSLQDRTDSANRLAVDAFVSIHANAYGSEWNDTGGIETYIHPTRPKEAVQLAEKIQKYMIAATGLKNRGIKTADFHVLRETNMTAVLLECGFMTNKEEAKLLSSDAFRKKCAEAIVKGIAEQYRLVKKAAIPPTTNKPGLFTVQVGAFSNRDTAADLVKRLKADGYEAIIEFEENK